MPEVLQTFINIFQPESVSRIIIPNIQRDYAQGRDTADIRRVRKRFLDALYKAVTTDAKIKLDFVYGDLSDGTLTPIDGQQRLTTLFLLHWYAARKENIPSEETTCLENFSYDTRPDSRDFCKFLVSSKVSFDGENLSDAIEDLAGFPLGWKKDPTVSSMLVMLDAIHEKFRGVENLWGKLKSGAISFYFLSIANMGLTDELYVTMNSRGKPLTEFEHFKAEFKSRLDEIDHALSDKIIRKIDTDWTDLLWTYRDENNLIGDRFLAYFGFLCDVILYRKGGTTQSRKKDFDSFDLLDEFLSGDARANVEFMEKNFDCWYALAKRKKISEFFAERVSLGSKTDKRVNRHERGKIIIYSGDTDLFGECVRSKNLPLGKVVMLYAFVIYLLNEKNISDADFRRRIRIVNNLVINSSDAELSDSETRNNGNRLPAMLEQVDSIILRGKVLARGDLKAANKYNFNENQITEEREKLLWTAKHPERAESLFELEDHYLLYGQIGVVGLEHYENFRRFISLFKCDYDKINCALLITGDYQQVERNGTRYQLGSTRPESWQNLFHKSALVNGFDYTKDFLDKLLNRTKNFSDAYLQGIIDEYLADCERLREFEWIYYYVKYRAFRPNRYGKYLWEDFEHAPYCLKVLWGEKKQSENSYQPFLKAADVSDNLSRDDFGLRLDFGDFYAACENDSYTIRDSATDVEADRLPINQRNGIDTEDRVAKFRAWLEKFLSV